jgi:hypothetical protein
MLTSSDPQLFLYPEELAEFTRRRRRQCKVEARSWESLDGLDQSSDDLPVANEGEIAYLQYSSGSTRFPHASPSPTALCSTTFTHTAWHRGLRDRPLCQLAALGTNDMGSSVACSRRSRFRYRSTI